MTTEGGQLVIHRPVEVKHQDRSRVKSPEKGLMLASGDSGRLSIKIRHESAPKNHSFRGNKSRAVWDAGRKYISSRYVDNAVAWPPPTPGAGVARGGGSAELIVCSQFVRFCLDSGFLPIECGSKLKLLELDFTT